MNKNDENTTIQELKDLFVEFRDKRDWLQFHNPKDIALALSVEIGELLELFLWKNKDKVQEEIKNNPEFKKEVEEELADVINYCITFANVTDIDISKIVKEKIELNDKKYPVEKAKGTATKYNKL